MIKDQRYFRRVLKIRAQDSPNVRHAEALLARGIQPDDKDILPGVLSYPLYRRRKATWDAIRQKVGLDAEFYEGAHLLLFPPDWLDFSHRLHDQYLSQRVNRQAEAIGIDPAEGGDETAMCAVDKLGIIDLVSKKTPDTSVITAEALAFMQYHRVPPEKTIFDRGGGGKQHADRLRQMGWNVTTVAFGESIQLDVKRARIRDPFATRLEQREDRYTYLNRRAEMYGELSLRMDPMGDFHGFSIPELGVQYGELRRQLSVFPKSYDAEGRLFIPPKNRKPGQDEARQKTLTELLGCSPDEADALVMAVWGLTHSKKRVVAGGMVL